MNQYNLYVFQLSEPANPYNCHALVTHAFGKKNLEAELYSVAFAGFRVEIRTNEALSVDGGKLRIGYDRGNLFFAVLVDMQCVQLLKPEGRFRIRLLASKSVRVGEEKFCPVWKSGFDEVAIHKFLGGAGLITIRIIDYSTGEAYRRKRVHIYNVFELLAEVEVNDLELFMTHQYAAIGQRKSYGFGYIRVIKGAV